ncbi:hypothetical protein BKA56DRAFT_493833 [Ilyonectria sp. MPI-CAGE-AT-0026]|nr:hypothetical protein BKA56DRAFT_493833 [Ilyonectria sp. MPI-CAGE-AT-0026]
MSPRARKPHRKTRTGCVTCKRRKIKCDEGRPVCANCTKFQAPCGFPKPGEALFLYMPALPKAEASDASSPVRKKPGRPRKVWSLEDVAEASADALQRWNRPHCLADAGGAPLNLDNVELLLHFTLHTGPSLAAHVDPDAADLRDFWVRNVPLIGLSGDYILHLMFSLAARHSLFLDPQPQDSERRRRLVSLSEQHMVAGVAGMAHGLSSLNESSSSALYLASILVCFCTLAAGPTGPYDLLLFNTGDLRPQACIPLIRGVRLIRQVFPRDVLFSGLMAPMNRSEGTQLLQWRSHWVRPRLDWVAALGRLKTLVSSQQDADNASRRHAFDILENIYEVVWGRDDSGVPAKMKPKYQFVLGWLYMMDDDYIATLQRSDHISLIVLAYFAPLLRVHQDSWFLQGWTEQLISSTRALLPDAYVSWIQWPLEAAVLIPSSPGKEE